MKAYKYFKILALCFIVLTAVSCEKEPAQDTSASFEIVSQPPYKAGAPLIIKITGKADFFTFFSGEYGAEFKNYPTDKGKNVSIPTDKSKEVTFSNNYLKAGTYEIVVYATSFGKQSKESKSDFQKKTITVIDERTAFSSFDIKSPELKGTIDAEKSEISFSVSSALNRSALIPVFFTTSAEAKVLVNNVEQTSGISPVDFSSDVVYTVVSPSGATKDYKVIFNTFAADSSRTLTEFKMTSPDIAAVIDQALLTISLNIPFGASANKLKIAAKSTGNSKITIAGKLVTATPKTLNLSAQPVDVTVTAESGDKRIYKFTSNQENPFTSFTFASLNPQPKAKIDHVNKTIEVPVLEGTNVKNLVATFTGNENAKTSINGVEQVSGVTANDFTSPLKYKIVGNSNLLELEYTVTVKVLSK